MVKELKRRAADPAALVLWIGIPLLIGGLMSLISSGPGEEPIAKLLVVDADDSFLSGLLLQAANGAPVVEVIEISDAEEGRARIDSGEGSALLLIPAGFGEAVFDRTPIELTLVKNPAQRILPGIIEEALDMTVEASFYVQRLFGKQLDMLSEGPPAGANFFDNVEIAQLSIDINDRMQRLETTLFPPVLKLEFVKSEEDSGAGFNIGQMLFPGMLFMSLLFIAMGISDDLWAERMAGTLRRMRAAPAGLWVFLASKIIAGCVVVAGVTVVGLLLGTVLWEFPISRLPLALVWSVFGGGSLLTLFFLLQTLASNQRGGNVIATMVVFPLMMVGGSFFPYEAMPPWMVSIGSLTPNGQAVQRLKEILSPGELDMAALAFSSMILLGVGVVCFMLGLLRLRKVA
ncbi:MAG: ABC-type multidrug transport system permease subunit [Planctomycetota bacterium]